MAQANSTYKNSFILSLFHQIKLLSNQRSVIGVDVDLNFVNIVQVQSVLNDQKIIRAVSEKVELIKDGRRETAITIALQKALNKFDIKSSDIIYTLSDQKAIVDHITMPLMPTEELGEAVKLQISNTQHYSIENPIFDFQILGRSLEKGIEKFNLIVAAIAKSSMDIYTSRFKASPNDALSGIKKSLFLENLMDVNITRAIPLSIAFENIIKESEKSETLAVLYIGASTSEINIYKEGKLDFTRKITLLAGDLTKALTSAIFTDSGKIELTAAEAQMLQKEFGIPSSGDNFLIRGKITANQALALLRPKLEQLNREIHRCFDYYYDKTQSNKIEKIILFGDAALLKGLGNSLNIEFGIPVTIGNPLGGKVLHFNGESEFTADDIQRLVAAIGASLSDSKGINLLPTAFRSFQVKFLQRVLVVLAACAMIGLFIFVYLGLLVQQTITKKQLENTKKEYLAILPKVNQIRTTLLAKDYVDHRMNIAKLMLQLSHLPKKVFITELKLEQDTLTLSGLVALKPQEAKAKLSRLEEELATNYLYNVRENSLKQSVIDASLTEFVIQAQLRKEEAK